MWKTVRVLEVEPWGFVEAVGDVLGENHVQWGSDLSLGPAAVSTGHGIPGKRQTPIDYPGSHHHPHGLVARAQGKPEAQRKVQNVVARNCCCRGLMLHSATAKGRQCSGCDVSTLQGPDAVGKPVLQGDKGGPQRFSSAKPRSRHTPKLAAAAVVGHPSGLSDPELLAASVWW